MEAFFQLKFELQIYARLVASHLGRTKNTVCPRFEFVFATLNNKKPNHNVQIAKSFICQGKLTKILKLKQKRSNLSFFLLDQLRVSNKFLPFLTHYPWNRAFLIYLLNYCCACLSALDGSLGQEEENRAVCKLFFFLVLG